jgi:hypothetical protein
MGMRAYLQIFLTNLIYFLSSTCLLIQIAGDRHGSGTEVRTETGADGNKLVWTYEGNWEHDKKSGHGVMHYPSGSVYSGQWANSKKNGFGSQTSATGDQYEGTWLNGKMHGNGVFTDGTTGDIYAGEWHTGKRHGYGEYTCDNRVAFSGLWREGVPIPEEEQEDPDL